MPHPLQPLRSSRRRFLASLGGLGSAAVGATLLGRRVRADDGEPTSASTSNPADRRLLFVICATGGASIIDSFMPVAADEVPDGVDANMLNVYDPSMLVRPSGSEIRGVKPLSNTSFLTSRYSIEQFLESHYADMTVVTQEVTSVNHTIAQKRALTGAGVNRGRTIAEAVAAAHGEDLPLANCSMGMGGYIEPGDDRSLPAHARGEVITSPGTFAMATHGSRGILGSPGHEDIERARRIREELEEVSPFGLTFPEAPLRQHYRWQRREVAPQLEQFDAITKLMLTPSEDIAPEYGLEGSPLNDDLRNAFVALDDDTWQQQSALSFLMSYYGLTCASTLSMSFTPSVSEGNIVGAPLAFDYSHTAHFISQNVMWGRVLEVVDALIGLLKRHDYLGDPALGKMWDRSLIYIATDFGRDKVRPAGATNFGTSHHLNNGSVLLSPMLRGNRVFGGVDPATLLTYGFDGRTGEARPGTVMREGDIYSLIAQAMGVDFEGRRDLSAVLA